MGLSRGLGLQQSTLPGKTLCTQCIASGEGVAVGTCRSVQRLNQGNSLTYTCAGQQQRMHHRHNIRQMISIMFDDTPTKSDDSADTQSFACHLCDMQCSYIFSAHAL